MLVCLDVPWSYIERTVGPAASTRVQSWRDETPKGLGCAGFPLPTGEEVWGGDNVLFCDLEMAYFGEF